MTVGHKGDKARTIDPVNEARRPLLDYLAAQGKHKTNAYIFTCQREKKRLGAGELKGLALE